MAELEAGDLQQASEKLWGATAQALKSVAERRGWKHNSHRHFYSIMAELEKQIDDPDLRRCFSAATDLHINFYEGWLSERQIRERANDVRFFIGRLAHLE